MAVVTARGGSKGLPGKNIKMLNGKPMIAWTIEAVHDSLHLDDLFISTDSREIAAVCAKYDATVSELRPPELAADETSSVDVLCYTLDLMTQRKARFDYLLLLEPTSPLRKASDIDNMIALAVDNPEADGVISLGRVHLEHPSIVKKINAKGYVIPYIEGLAAAYQRQQEDDAFFPYGVGYLMKVDRFLATRTIYMEKMLPYYIERWQNYEVDDIFDFACISAIMEQRGGNNG